MERRSSVLAASLWMFFITALLFWLPVAGPLIGGFVGGRKVRRVGSAIMAVFLPAIITGLFFAFVGTSLTGIPLIGALAGVGTGILVLGQIGPLLIGAILGAVL